MTKDVFVLKSSDGSAPIELPVESGTIGPDVLDITKLYKEKKVFTYDPGFVSTASCHSKITYIDGDEGILLYRGYPVEQLAKSSNFIEVAYLLLYGELPNKNLLNDYSQSTTEDDIKTIVTDYGLT